MKNVVLIIVILFLSACSHTPTTTTTTKTAVETQKVLTAETANQPSTILTVIQVKQANQCEPDEEYSSCYRSCNGTYVRPDTIVTYASCFQNGIYPVQNWEIINQDLLSAEKGVIKLGDENEVSSVVFSDQSGLVIIKTEPARTEMPFPLKKGEPNMNGMQVSGFVFAKNSRGDMIHSSSPTTFPTRPVRYKMDKPISVMGTNHQGMEGASILNNDGQLIGIVGYNDKRDMSIIPVSDIIKAL